MDITPIDAYAFKRKLTGMDITDIPTSPLVTALLTGIDPSIQDQFKLLMNIVNSNPGIQRAILAIDPKSPPPNGKQSREIDVPVPVLPKAARLTDEQIKAAERAGLWLSAYTAWSADRSRMTPRYFLEASGLWLIGVATARRAMVTTHDRIFPHLYMLWVATTTRYAKSTGLKCARDVMDQAFPYLLLPHESTPESTFKEFSGEKPENMDSLPETEREIINNARRFAAQRALLIDEASSLLGSGKKDYMQGYSEWLMKAYDAPERLTRSTRSSGLQVVNRVGLSILGATTPAAMARNITPDRWEDGDLARYALLFPEGSMPFDDDWGAYSPPDYVVDQLKLLHERLPQPGNSWEQFKAPDIMQVRIEDDVKTAMKKYRKAYFDMTESDLDQRLHGNYGRLPVQCIKVALSLALIDWCDQAVGNPPVMRMGHWARAQMITEQWRSSLHRLLQAISESKDSRAQTRIISILKYSPTGLTLRDISRSCGIPTKELQSAIHVLVESGEVETQDFQNPSGGPSTKVYRVVS